jgi:hypothetical protein
VKRKTSAQKRASANERKYIDRAILRLTRTFYCGSDKLSEPEFRELMGLVLARRRVP